MRDEHKFDSLVEFATSLPRLRKVIDRDMRRRGADRRRVLATVVHLLDRTLIRVGNDEYARANGSFGLTTLRSKHIISSGGELRLQFKGKSGKLWNLQVKDRRISRMVRSLQELPGQHLFQYADDDGKPHVVTSAEVNEYLREIAQREITAKYFRTWGGTVLAALALHAAGPFSSQREAKRKLNAAIRVVAERLGNTPKVCRECYVHPIVIARFMSGTLPHVAVGELTGRGLPPEERTVLRLLKVARGDAQDALAKARPPVPRPQGRSRKRRSAAASRALSAA